MRFDAHFGDAEAVQLKAAILLYGGAKRIAFASVHEPYRDPEGGAPYLDAGRPISTEFLRTLARGLGFGMAPEILPEAVVMRTPEVTAWWVPATIRPMFFSEVSDGKTLNGASYPHPSLVFVVDGEHGLSVRALTKTGGRGHGAPLQLRRTGTSIRLVACVLAPWPRRAQPGCQSGGVG
jgi:PRTRC genetic system protein B